MEPKQSASEALVAQLHEQGLLKTRRIIEAFKAVPRSAFVRPEDRAAAGIDEPLPTGFGQTTSAPSMIATLLEVLQPQPGHAVLEIGTGLGWTAALIAHAVGPTGSVISYELEPDLAAQAAANLRKAGIANVEARPGDGTKAPGTFDRILLACAAPAFPPALVKELRRNGRLVAPLGGPLIQELTLLEKKDGTQRTSMHGPCRFVPLR